MAQFSVIPYPLVILIPIFLNHALCVSNMGAAPETIARALLNPRAFLNLRLSIPDRIGIRMSLLSFSSGSFASIPVWNLVQIRGTAKNTVGCVS